MSVNERIEKLREKMKAASVSAYYIPSSDPHQSEYLPANYKTREYISGFTGSAGSVVVTQTEAILWTDGRYFLQAENQLKGSCVQLYKMAEPGVPTVTEYLAKNLKAGSRFGMDGKVMPLSVFENMKKELGNIEFVTDVDFIGEIWDDRPEPSSGKAFVHDEKYAGKSAKEKIAQVRQLMEKAEADATIIGALEDVCYLFNIRGRDVRCNPVVTAYALVEKNRAVLFVCEKKLTEEVKNYLKSQDVCIMDYNGVFSEAEKLRGTVYLDPSRTNVFLRSCIKAAVKQGLNFTSRLKAVKNETELENFRKTMITDGIAMVKILKWAEDNADSGVSEWDVSEKLLSFRAQGENFIEESFETIAGYGENGAIIHYSPAKEGSAVLKPRSFLLLDSGGHYWGGTTDITRTIPLGVLSAEEKENYTLVLKSHIQLALAKFKKGTTGFALDTIAREPLWRMGKDYKHGTGHGVGFVLSVHEGPQSISNRYTDTPLEKGMVTSNEPGIYIAGSHGIRIESLIVTEDFVQNEHGEFLQFETITLCPIDTRPVIKDLMLKEEIDWLNDYHKKVYSLLEDRLDAEHKEFLKERTKPL